MGENCRDCSPRLSGNRHKLVKILFVTASLPFPPQQGGALRTYGLLHGLYHAGHQITLLSFHDTDNPADFHTDSPLGIWCERIDVLPSPRRTKSERLLNIVRTRQPDIAQRLLDAAFADRLLNMIGSTPFDLIQFEGIEVACYLALVKSTFPNIKLIYDAFNAEAAMQRDIFNIDRHNLRRWPAAIYSWLQASRIAAFEQQLCSQADLVIAVSPEDAAILQAYDPPRPIPVVANGIFVNEYDRSTEARELGKNTIAFTGKMDYRPNVDAAIWFAESVLPLVQQSIPDAKFYIIGQKPHPALQALSQNPNVVITGRVEQVLPYLKAAHVYAAPLRMGSGTRLKILEAMAARAAIVATPVAASGIKRVPEMGMMIAETPQAFAATIINLLQAPDQRAKLGDAAYRYVSSHYDWSIIIPQLLQAYEALQRA